MTLHCPEAIYRLWHEVARSCGPRFSFGDLSRRPQVKSGTGIASQSHDLSIWLQAGCSDQVPAHLISHDQHVLAGSLLGQRPSAPANIIWNSPCAPLRVAERGMWRCVVIRLSTCLF